MKKIILSLSILVFLASCAGKEVNLETQNTNSGTGVTNSIVEEKFYLDVREDSEWEAGHVDGATHLKLGDILDGKVDSIPKDKEVYIYCRSGNRSGQAVKYLQEKGFTNVINAGAMKDLKGVNIVQ